MRKTIGFPHPPLAVGGPSSFQERFTKELVKRGYRIVYPHEKIWPDVVFVLAGTTKLLWVYRCKLRGAKIVHRLDSLHWQYKYGDRSAYYKGRARSRNVIMTFIRRFLATDLVYQSKFVEDWWIREEGQISKPSCVIYNGVDLSEFSPGTRKNIVRKNSLSILCAESKLERDNVSIEIIRHLSSVLARTREDFSIKVLGFLDSYDETRLRAIPRVKICPPVLRGKMPGQYQRSDILISLDINAACPNTVIEALSCGLPIVGFRTGALPEIVPPIAGVLANYGGNPWKRETPDLVAIERAMLVVLSGLDEFRAGARRTAEERFDSGAMTEKYIEVIEAPRQAM